MEASSARRLPLALLFLLLISPAGSETSGDFRLALISFLKKLSASNPQIDGDLGWTAATDPCVGRWRGVACNRDFSSVRSIVIESLKLDGSIDGDLLSLLCNSSSLSVLSLKDNALGGVLPPEIGACSKLTHVYLSGNRLSGGLPSSLPNLRSLKRLDLSSNNFSGELPWNLSTISGLATFLASHNRISGAIPRFDLSSFDQFNVSFNQLSGPLPQHSENFPLSSFAGNPGLCGRPLQVECASLPPSPPPASPPPPSSSNTKSTNISPSKVIMAAGYVLFALAVVLFVGYRYLKKKKERAVPIHKEEPSQKMVSAESSGKTGNASRSEYSISSSAQSAAGASSSLVVLRRDGEKELRFEDLLRAPAELLGKGRFGSLYKVVVDGCSELAVKRIKDWTVSGEEFRKKMMRMDQASHPNVLPVTAFYCSKQEKLVVYEFQKNGSLYGLLHGKDL